uniref:Fungal lipase-type domain-containing protein n=1 Tax=Chromera velia CCMP2878 TaxID=1169474 RepID=A0A0G4FQ40_9ALVE|eukprot:Cvel_18005.t1-p1 / transcript=Cvel_18005.t1 / gene=Cvel_18005 / organism=Chromera_velia_CCMP2878 / gene_product=hypothetical protein / transcript_product=hypothetical protein / location=Cvel_scaffold1468:6708-10623(-) / protein_length=1071 / sequence_SO=supercontig / SO=protein_coding / is_pseudo=false
MTKIIRSKGATGGRRKGGTRGSRFVETCPTVAGSPSLRTNDGALGAEGDSDAFSLVPSIFGYAPDRPFPLLLERGRKAAVCWTCAALIALVVTVLVGIFYIPRVAVRIYFPDARFSTVHESDSFVEELQHSVCTRNAAVCKKNSATSISRYVRVSSHPASSIPMETTDTSSSVFFAGPDGKSRPRRGTVAVLDMWTYLAAALTENLSLESLALSSPAKSFLRRWSPFTFPLLNFEPLDSAFLWDPQNFPSLPAPCSYRLSCHSCLQILKRQSERATFQCGWSQQHRKCVSLTDRLAFQRDPEAFREAAQSPQLCPRSASLAHPSGGRQVPEEWKPNEEVERNPIRFSYDKIALRYFPWAQAAYAEEGKAGSCLQDHLGVVHLSEEVRQYMGVDRLAGAALGGRGRVQAVTTWVGLPSGSGNEGGEDEKEGNHEHEQDASTKIERARNQGLKGETKTVTNSQTPLRELIVAFAASGEKPGGALAATARDNQRLAVPEGIGGENGEADLHEISLGDLKKGDRGGAVAADLVEMSGKFGVSLTAWKQVLSLMDPEGKFPTDANGRPGRGGSRKRQRDAVAAAGELTRFLAAHAHTLDEGSAAERAEPVRFTFTGHSTGGAVAVLAAVWFTFHILMPFDSELVPLKRSEAPLWKEDPEGWSECQSVSEDEKEEEKTSDSASAVSAEGEASVKEGRQVLKFVCAAPDGRRLSPFCCNMAGPPDQKTRGDAPPPPLVRPCVGAVDKKNRSTTGKGRKASSSFTPPSELEKQSFSSDTAASFPSASATEGKSLRGQLGDLFARRQDRKKESGSISGGSPSEKDDEGTVNLPRLCARPRMHSVRIVTFGASRPGDVRLASLVARMLPDSWRIVNSGDAFASSQPPCTHLDPQSPMAKGMSKPVCTPYGFWHAGTEVLLRRRSASEQPPAAESLLAAPIRSSPSPKSRSPEASSIEETASEEFAEADRKQQSFGQPSVFTQTGEISLHRELNFAERLPSSSQDPSLSFSVCTGFPRGEDQECSHKTPETRLSSREHFMYFGKDVVTACQDRSRNGEVENSQNGESERSQSSMIPWWEAPY